MIRDSARWRLLIVVSVVISMERADEILPESVAGECAFAGVATGFAQMLLST